jgi:outer membrane biosynthesis protein TonB
MSAGARIAAAVTAGYLLGRTKKLRLAITVGGMLAGKKIATDPRGLLKQGAELVEGNPELAKLQAQIQGKVLEAARTAAIAAAVNRMDVLSGAIRERTDRLALPASAQEALGDEDEYEDDEYEDDEYEEDEPEEEEPEEEEPEPEPERPRRRRTTSAAAKRADRTVKKSAPAKKATSTAKKTSSTAKKSQPAKKATSTAKKTSSTAKKSQPAKKASGATRKSSSSRSRSSRNKG